MNQTFTAICIRVAINPINDHKISAQKYYFKKTPLNLLIERKHDTKDRIKRRNKQEAGNKS